MASLLSKTREARTLFPAREEFSDGRNRACPWKSLRLEDDVAGPGITKLSHCIGAAMLETSPGRPATDCTRDKPP